MYTKAELLNLYNMDLEDLLKESQKCLKKEVEFCSIISARTGKCSQNCKYCSQSTHYNTDIYTHPLVSVDEVIKTAKSQQLIFYRRKKNKHSSSGYKAYNFELDNKDTNINIKNGIDLNILTIVPKIKLTPLLGLKPFFEVVYSKTPKGRPRI